MPAELILQVQETLVANCDDKSFVFIRSPAPYKSYTE